MRQSGVVTAKTADFFKLDINAPAPGVLPSIAFNGATKRNRPNLNIGAVVYCRVLSAHKDLDTQLTCEWPETKKGWSTGEVYLCNLTNGGEEKASGEKLKGNESPSSHTSKRNSVGPLSIVPVL